MLSEREVEVFRVVGRVGFGVGDWFIGGYVEVVGVVKLV